MKRVVTSILLLLVVSFSYPILSQQRNVIINTNSVDRTVITTDPNVDIWTQLEQERIAAERAEQERIAAERTEQARIAAEKAEQERIAAENTEQERIAAENTEQAHIADKKGTQPIAVETIETQSIQQIASTDDIQKCEQEHKQIVKLASRFSANRVFYKYDNLYKKLPKTTENIQNLLKIQIIVSSYFNTNGSSYPYLGSQLKNTTSMEEEIAIFLSYYQE
jgi:hypothetical protein